MLPAEKNTPHQQRYTQTENERIKMIFHVNGIKKQAGVAILIYDKWDVNPKLGKRYKGHYILVTETINAGDITIVNLFALDVSVLNFIKQTLFNIKR